LEEERGLSVLSLKNWIFLRQSDLSFQALGTPQLKL